MDAVKEFKKILSIPMIKLIEEKFNYGLITYYEFLKAVCDAYEQMNLAKSYLNEWLEADISLDEMLHSETEIARKEVISPMTLHKYEVAVCVSLEKGKVITYIDNDEWEVKSFKSYKGLNNNFLVRLNKADKSAIVKYLCNDISKDTWQKIANKEIDDEAARDIDEHERIYGADGEKWQATQGLYVR